MIKFDDLQADDSGRWVYYKQFDGSKELGRLKSWRDGTMFAVFQCRNLWVDYLNYTAAGCSPSDLDWKFPDGHDKQVEVIFRKYVSPPAIVALFPQLPGNVDKPLHSCLSWMSENKFNQGGHGEAVIDVVMESTQPCTTLYGYREAMAELIEIGYNVKVVDKFTTSHRESRKKPNDIWQRCNLTNDLKR